MIREDGRWRFPILFFLIQVLFVFIVIYRESYFISLFYTLQKAQKRHVALVARSDALNIRLHESQDLGLVKNYAESTLHFKSIPLTTIRDINDQPSK